MPPFLSYSGRRGSHRGRGRGRAGRGAVGRGRGRTTIRTPYFMSGIDGTPYSARGISLIRTVNVKNHEWNRSPRSAETKGDINNFEERESELKNIPGASAVVGTDKVINGSNSQKEKYELLSLSKYVHPIMKKNGNHQLILSSKTKIRSVAPAVFPGDSLSDKELQPRQLATQGQTLTREGKNKLVSLVSSNVINSTEQKREPSMDFHSKHYKYNAFRGHQNSSSSIGDAINRRAKLASSSTIYRHFVKRVKLSVQPCSTVKDEDSIACGRFEEDSDCVSQSSLSTNQTGAGTDTNSKSKRTEKLSDFAYREINRVKQQPMIPRSNLHWLKKSNNESCNNTYSDKAPLPSPTFLGNPNKRPNVKNMGLVRIQPDERTTPICPTFFRGIHCQNQYCRKRHDIPKEYALPVCSFFQRHGQCLRGETCVFRHIKVNEKALVCPSFALLGFCEDEKCIMQHIHGRKGTDPVNTNISCAIAAEESPSRFRKKPNNTYYRNRSTSGGRP